MAEPTDKLTFDLDGDGVPDVVVSDTNGHTVYVNVRWLVVSMVTAVGALAGLAFVSF